MSVRQINPAGDVKQVTCQSRKKCVLPLDIQTGTTRQTLTVGISFVSGNLLVQFQTPKGFLYAGEKTPTDAKHPLYLATWPLAVPKGKAATTQVTLSEPLVEAPITAPMVDKPGKAVADLEITVEAKP